MKKNLELASFIAITLLFIGTVNILINDYQLQGWKITYDWRWMIGGFIGGALISVMIVRLIRTKSQGAADAFGKVDTLFGISGGIATTITGGLFTIINAILLFADYVSSNWQIIILALLSLVTMILYVALFIKERKHVR